MVVAVLLLDESSLGNVVAVQAFMICACVGL